MWNSQNYWQSVVEKPWETAVFFFWRGRQSPASQIQGNNSSRDKLLHFNVHVSTLSPSLRVHAWSYILTDMSLLSLVLLHVSSIKTELFLKCNPFKNWVTISNKVLGKLFEYSYYTCIFHMTDCNNEEF